MLPWHLVDVFLGSFGSLCLCFGGFGGGACLAGASLAMTIAGIASAGGVGGFLERGVAGRHGGIHPRRCGSSCWYRQSGAGGSEGAKETEHGANETCLVGGTGVKPGGTGGLGYGMGVGDWGRDGLWRGVGSALVREEKMLAICFRAACWLSEREAKGEIFGPDGAFISRIPTVDSCRCELVVDILAGHVGLEGVGGFIVSGVGGRGLRM
jgi:hypothetical protein